MLTEHGARIASAFPELADVPALLRLPGDKAAFTFTLWHQLAAVRTHLVFLADARRRAHVHGPCAPSRPASPSSRTWRPKARAPTPGGRSPTWTTAPGPMGTDQHQALTSTEPGCRSALRHHRVDHFVLPAQNRVQRRGRASIPGPPGHATRRSQAAASAA